MVCLDIWHYWHFGLEILSGKSFLFTTGCFVSSLNSTHRYCFIYDNLGKWKSVMSDSLWPHGLQPARLSCQWNSIGQNTGVGSHSLFQGIFLTQGSNPGLLHLQADSLPSELPGKTLNCYTQIHFLLCPLLFSHLIHGLIQLIHSKLRLPPWNLQLILVTILL